MRILSESPLTVITVARGEIWILPDRGDPIHLESGDVALTRAPGHYTVADNPGTEPTIEIHPGEVCLDLNGEPLEEEMSLGVRTWGHAIDADTVMMVGAYLSVGEIGARLLRALPPVLSLSRDQWDHPLLPIFCDEIVRDEPGQTVVLDRMLDVIAISALRAWFARPEAEPPSWYRALSDPVVGPAIRLMQQNPANSWTVAKVAAEAGVSRAALARRFRDLVGESPMAFLTGWRLDIAADLILDDETTLAAVAHHVGYGSPFALSAAFKRERGISPQQHRELVSRRDLDRVPTR